mmetsp:Transcript_79123/g.219910  ORF Transcript_79123/g.219910 Transcript_79123/m.219910 type:complete len:231 (+) Transcript_79123:607-1299(+)
MIQEQYTVKVLKHVVVTKIALWCELSHESVHGMLELRLKARDRRVMDARHWQHVAFDHVRAEARQARCEDVPLASGVVFLLQFDGRSVKSIDAPLSYVLFAHQHHVLLYQQCDETQGAVREVIEPEAMLIARRQSAHAVDADAKTVGSMCFQPLQHHPQNLLLRIHYIAIGACFARTLRRCGGCVHLFGMPSHKSVSHLHLLHVLLSAMDVQPIVLAQRRQVVRLLENSA